MKAAFQPWGEMRYARMYCFCRSWLQLSDEHDRDTVQDQIVSEYLRLIESGIPEEEMAPKFEEFLRLDPLLAPSASLDAV
ncbi:MAG: hypothetical protein ABI630_09835 [Betaproteobacteria bacterium]